MAEKTESCQRPGRQRPGRQRPGRQRPGRQRPGRQLAEVSTNWGCCGAASSPRVGPAAGRSRAGGVSKNFFAKPTSSTVQSYSAALNWRNSL